MAVKRPADAVRRIAEIADQLTGGPANARDLIGELFQLYAEVLRKEEPIVRPIETAPKVAHRKVLLFCPKQDGWQVGEWTGERWVSVWKLEFLDPTHWTDVPPPP
jgi:hypothetical protein